MVATEPVPPSGRPPADSVAPLRLFFALWPPAEVAEGLHALARQAAAHGGRAMRRDTLHLTLAFLGTTPVQRLPALLQVGTDTARSCRAFTLPLDRLGFWPRKHLVWAGPNQAPAELLAVHARLAELLGPALADPRFQPHLTLVRKAGGPPVAPAAALAAAPMRWRVDELLLVRSQVMPDGAHYAPVGRWPLGAGQ